MRAAPQPSDVHMGTSRPDPRHEGQWARKGGAAQNGAQPPKGSEKRRTRLGGILLRRRDGRKEQGPMDSVAPASRKKKAAIRYVSLFSGIEAAGCAWRPLGWDAVAFSEIDPFCNAVLSARFPDVPNLGDIRDVDWRDLGGEADIVVGGSPCQSFSVAGNRTGLEGESGLMLEYIRAVREIMPRCFLWENVPGALSCEDGKAFELLLGKMDELGYGLAWRVLDAQFFGVPQRRERVYLVGVLGSAARACEVLFESESMPWDAPTSREKRAALADKAQGGPRSAGFRFNAPPAAKGIGYVEEGSPTMTAGRCPAVCYGIAGNTVGRAPGNGGNGQGFCDPDEAGMYTLTAADRHAVAAPAGGRPADALCVASTNPNASIGEELCGSLTASAAKGGPMVCPGGGPVAFAQNVRDELRLVGGKGDHVGALAASPGAKQASHVLEELCVRRLTPLECERLQGFPDGWTDVEYRGKPACDTPRYRALGNSMAVPVIRWIGKRMEANWACGHFSVPE